MKILKNKKQKAKVYFLIINLIVSIIAINVLISSVDAGINDDCPDCPTTPPTTPPTTDGIVVGVDDVIKDGDVTKDDEDPGKTGIGGDTGGTDTGGPDTGGGTGGTGGTGGGGEVIGSIFGNPDWMGIITKAGLFAGVGGTIGALAGGDDGQLWGALAGAAGGAVAGLLEPIGKTKAFFIGLGVAALIFVLTYKKSSTEIVEFHCLPWQAPTGGKDCSLCQQFEDCSEYTCKSLGQACNIVNAGTKEQKCVWMNPHDVNSPTIKFKEVNEGLLFKPDNNLRPPATGVVITREKQECIQAFTPLKFTFETNEPAQCKVDYNLTTGFEEMSFYIGGNSLFVYNHTEELSLPGPDAINAIAPELKNDGSYTLFVRCQDANGNYNQDAYSISFCVDKGPDTTPPKIVDVNIPSNNPVSFDKMDIDLEVYVNEPAQCNWDREDRDFKDMANKMTCSLNIWEMNNQNVYTCRTTLNGIENRKENKYYFRCKDKPWAEEGDRNVNSQSYLYTVIGTQPLNVLEIKPSQETISGATNLIPVFLEIKTDNGYNKGEALCYYHSGTVESEEDYILFSETKSNLHIQRQDLPQGNYNYYFKCVDLGGNTEYNSTSFRVETDRQSPLVVRTYKESGELKIITSEKSECSYSTADCNFEIDNGILMLTLDSKSHNAEWINNQKYFIRCKDEFNNQPNPNICSIVLRAANNKEDAGVIVL